MYSRTKRSGAGPRNRRKAHNRPPVASDEERYLRVADKVEACIAALRAGGRPVEILRQVRETEDRDLNYVMFPILEEAQLERIRSSRIRHCDGLGADAK